MAIVRFAPEGYGTIHTQGREDELLQIRPLGLAIAMRNRQGHRLLRLVLRVRRRPILPIDADRRRIKVHVPLVQPKHLIGTHGAGGEELHSADLVEAIEDTPDGVVMKGLRRDGLAQKQCRVLLGKELLQAVQRTASTQGIEDHAKHNGPWIDGHLG